MRRAFTLVELLVVIGIITILISILLPVMGKVRQQSISTKCSMNLRSLAQGWSLYAGATKGLSCPGRLPTYNGAASTFGMGDGEEYRPRWYELLGAQTKIYATHNPKKIEDDSWTIESDLFLCKAVSDWTNSRNYVYGYNYQFLGNARKRPDGKWIHYPVKSSSIKAAETVMALDCMGTAAGKPANKRTGHYNNGTKDLFAMGNKGFLVDPPRLAANSDYADPQNRGPANRSGPDPRHLGKVNVAFCDGHVESMTLRDLGYVVRPDGSQEARNPAATNKLFSGTGRDSDPPSVN